MSGHPLNWFGHPRADEIGPYAHQFTILSTGWPWGWCAILVDDPPKTWGCPHCGRTRRQGRCWYPFTAACSECARRGCQAIWRDPNPQPTEIP